MQNFPQLFNARVLVLEDEPLILMSFKETLSELGCAAVFGAGHTRDAESLLGQEHFDLAVLDVHIGQGDSYELARIMNARGIRLVFSSGSGSDEIPAEFAAVPFVGKPFHEYELVDALVRAMEPRPLAPPAA